MVSKEKMESPVILAVVLGGSRAGCGILFAFGTHRMSCDGRGALLGHHGPNLMTDTRGPVHCVLEGSKTPSGTCSGTSHPTP